MADDLSKRVLETIEAFKQKENLPRPTLNGLPTSAGEASQRILPQNTNVNALTEALNHEREKSHALETRNAFLQEQLANLQQNFSQYSADKENEIALIRQQANQSIFTLQQEIQDISNKASEFATADSKLQQSVNSLSDQLRISQKKFNFECDAKRRVLEELNEVKLSKNNELEIVLRDVAEKNEEIGKLKSEIEQLQGDGKERASLLNKNVQLQSNQTEIVSRMQALDMEASKYKETIAQIKEEGEHKVRDLSEKILLIENELKSVKQRNEELLRDKEILQQKLLRTDEEQTNSQQLTILRQQLSNAEAEMYKLTNTNMSLSEESSGLKNLLQQYQDELQRVRMLNSNANIEQTASNAAEKNSSPNILQSSESERLKKELSSLRSVLEQTTRTNYELQSDLAKQSQKTSSTYHQVQYLQNELESKAKECMDLKARLLEFKEIVEEQRVLSQKLRYAFRLNEKHERIFTEMDTHSSGCGDIEKMQLQKNFEQLKTKFAQVMNEKVELQTKLENSEGVLDTLRFENENITDFINLYQTQKLKIDERERDIKYNEERLHDAVSELLRARDLFVERAEDLKEVLCDENESFERKTHFIQATVEQVEELIECQTDIQLDFDKFEKSSNSPDSVVQYKNRRNSQVSFPGHIECEVVGDNISENGHASQVSVNSGRRALNSELDSSSLCSIRNAVVAYDGNVKEI